MTDDSPSVFDDESPEPPSTPEPTSWKPSALMDRYGGFKLGILLVLAGHIITMLVLLAVFCLPESGMGMNGMDSMGALFSMVLLSLGLTCAVVQWLYVVPLAIVGLVFGFAKQQWRLFLGVLTAGVGSFLLAFPLCGLFFTTMKF